MYVHPGVWKSGLVKPSSQTQKKIATAKDNVIHSYQQVHSPCYVTI